MALYKLVSDGVVVDAICDESALWIVENPHNYSTYIGKRELAKGVQSSDGEKVWHISGMEKFHDFPDYTTVEMIEIGGGEYLSILEDLSAEKIILVENEEPVPEEEGHAPAKTALQLLKEKVDSLLPPQKQPETTIEGIISNKLAELSECCNKAITAGVDVVLSDGEVHHFSLTVEDQINMISLTTLLAAGQTDVPYHADGEGCRMFSFEEFNAVTVAATQWKVYQESYYNSLKAWVSVLTDPADINSIQYGDEIPERFQTDILKGMLHA